MKRLCLSLLCAFTLTALADEAHIQISPEQIDNLGIQLGTLSTAQQIPLCDAPARVVVPSQHEHLVSAPQPGFLTQLSANIGDTVKKGQILAQINSPESIALQQQFLSAQNALQLAELERSRDEKLFTEGVIAARRWQETQANYRNQLAQADESRQLLSLAGLSAADIQQLSQARQFKQSLAIRAPINGVVLERLATLGSRLDLQAPLYRLADLSELWLEIHIPQEKAAALSLGNLVQIDNSPVQAQISLLGQQIEASSQTLLARAVVQTGAQTLRVGQSLTVKILQNNETPGFAVPNTAIAQHAGQSYIFIRTPQGFKVTMVKILGKQADKTLISGDFAADSQLALQGAVALKAHWLGLGDDE